MALIIIGIAVIAFVITGAFVGFYAGYDKGFEDALECYEQEVKDVLCETGSDV